MNGTGATQQDMKAVSQTARRLLGLADLAERAAGRLFIVRLLVIWALRPAESAAWAHIARFAPQMLDMPAPDAFRLTLDSATEVMLMAQRFRALAQLINILDAYGVGLDQTDLPANWQIDRNPRCPDADALAPPRFAASFLRRSRNAIAIVSAAACARLIAQPPQPARTGRSSPA